MYFGYFGSDESKKDISFKELTVSFEIMGTFKIIIYFYSF